MKFIGIDLGWTSGESGLCCLGWENRQLQLLEVDRKQDVHEILAWVDRWLPRPDPGAIAVDAPTIIPNATGMRLPDKLTHKYFGRYHAGCYPANLQSRFAQKTVEFGEALAGRGFAHAPEIVPQKLGRYQIEVFPHPATINLFGLEKILKYKKGILAERQAELTKLCQYIAEVLPNLEPKLNVDVFWQSFAELLGKNNLGNQLTLKGKQLKALEDKIDALLCAYIAAYWWYWGRQRNLVLGDRATGYIVIPQSQKSDNTCGVGAAVLEPYSAVASQSSTVSPGTRSISES